METPFGLTESPLWVVTPFDDEQTQKAAVLAESLRLSPLVARILVQRKLHDPEEARLYLEPSLAGLHDPFLLPDMDKAVERLTRAIASKEKIFLHGDYDADGITSSALFFRALSSLGANITGFVPTRTSGYDLQRYGVDKAREAGATLILTCDCGSCAIDAIEYANGFGMDVIVTDHHRPGAELPAAYAIVNPYRKDATVPFRDLCGAGVAFKVMDALVGRIAPEHHSAFRYQFVDLAALGTVADMTPLVHENRILVAWGLRALSEGKKTGLRALLRHLKIDPHTVTAETISFQLAPKLNAVGRIDDADLAYRLLVTKSGDEAEMLAQRTLELHSVSKEESARITTEAMEQALGDEHIGRRVLVLAKEAWTSGVVGIAANRIVEQCRRPVVLLSYNPHTDTYHGSARSYGGFNLHEALHGCHDLLERYGGHSASAGVSLRGAANLAAFRARLHDLAEGFITDEVPPQILNIDAEVADGSELTFDLVEQLCRLGPFGRENPEPVFASRGAMVLRSMRMGKSDRTHLKLLLRLPGATQPVEAISWGKGDLAERFTVGDDVDVAFRPNINHFNGRASVQLMMEDVRLSE
jgi:single-stranded-DNA-specific exonuclease